VLDTVLLNAAAAVACAAGVGEMLVEDLGAGLARCREAVAGGTVAGLLERWAAAAS
jgi:anthranilate phosphoribosyltransferase